MRRNRGPLFPVKLKDINARILRLYAAAIQNMAPVRSEYDKRKLQEQACRLGLVRWTDRQRQKVGAIGFLTGLPGGGWILPMVAADIAYLMAVAGRGCYGIGHVLKRPVDYERDIPLILAIWSGAAHVASAATVGQVALHVANPIIIQVGSNAAVGFGVAAVQSLVGQTGSKIIGMLMPKFLAKIGAQLTAKAVSTAVPILGGFASCGVNWWICGGLMHAAETYYLADFVVLEGEATECVATVRQA